MLTVLDKTLLPIDLKMTACIAVQMRVGETPLGYSATRTARIRNLDPDITREQAMEIYKAHEARGHFEHPVSKIRLLVLCNDVIWLDDENMAKLERRKERAARKAQREAERAERAERKAAKLAEKEAKRAAKEASKNAAKQAAQSTLDFAAAAFAAGKAAPAAAKEAVKEEKKAFSPAPAKKTAHGFTDQEIERYAKKLDVLTEGKPPGSVVRLTYKQLLGLGIPVNFIRHYWGMTPQHQLPVTVGGTTEQAIDIDTHRAGPEPTPQNDAGQAEQKTADIEDADQEKLEKELAAVDMAELIKRMEKIHAAHGVPFSLAGPQEGEAPLHVFDRIQAAVTESAGTLPRALRRKMERAVDKELDHLIADARNK